MHRSATPARPQGRSRWRSGAAYGRSCFPVILLLGLRFGIFTPSEIGAFAVVYAVVIGFFVYRDAHFCGLPRGRWKAA